MSLPPTLTAQLWHWAETTRCRPFAIKAKVSGVNSPGETSYYSSNDGPCTSPHWNQTRRLRLTLADNRPEWLYVDLATQTLGGRSVGIHQTNPADEVRFIVNHSDSRLLFCEDQEQVDKAIDIRDAVKLSAVAFDNRGLRHYDSTLLSSGIPS